MKFVSTGFIRQDGDDYVLEGNLTIKDVTRAVKLRAEFGGTVRDPWGNIKSAFSLSGKINRNDWGLSYNAALETGGVLLSEEVRILAEVQMTEVVAQEVKETVEA
jgi:polyisoprenoid-binding protein YceI